MDGEPMEKPLAFPPGLENPAENINDIVQYFSHISGTLLQRRVNLSREAGREDQRWQISVIRAAVSRRKQAWTWGR